MISRKFAAHDNSTFDPVLTEPILSHQIAVVILCIAWKKSRHFRDAITGFRATALFRQETNLGVAKCQLFSDI